ncbi:hypothetical protein [Streptomyces radicis]|uniref:hypothetical protein n=1 Tax=Streptomyces radicis TaxID=1750517 RepID=UPI0011C41183|nr:hypothetical protein [Streptomyces radicis]
MVTAALGDIGNVTAGGTTTGWAEAGYPRTPTRYRRNADGTVVAVAPRDRVTYRWRPAAQRMDVRSEHGPALARATARVTREMVRAQLVTSGWVLLHASAAVLDGERAVLALGGRGAGKSTVALTLASRGAQLLGNDRVFARATEDGGVELAPWPSGAAVGLGLMRALGWADVARRRWAAGAEPHPSQDPRVTAALLTGRSEPPRVGERELKAHVRPEDFTGWFGLRGASSGRVAVTLFPLVRPGAEPQVDDGRATALTDADFMSGAVEDSYPDIFGLTGGANAGTALARAKVAARLGALPTRAIALGHDHRANVAFLEDITTHPDAEAVVH